MRTEISGSLDRCFAHACTTWIVPFGYCVQCWVAGWIETWNAEGRWAHCVWSQLCLSSPRPPGKVYLQYHSLLRDTRREKVWMRAKEAGANEKLGYYENKCWYHISPWTTASGFLPALYAIGLRRVGAAKEKVTAISYSDSWAERLHGLTGFVGGLGCAVE